MQYFSFSISAFAYLYHSLVHLSGMRPVDAACLIYELYTANIDSFETHNPDHLIKEANPIAFAFIIRKRGRPYKTKVQFYKSIQALLESMDWSCLTFSQKKAVKYLQGIRSQIDWQFYDTCGMDIESDVTVYNDCRNHLNPGANEPDLPFRMLDKVFQGLKS